MLVETPTLLITDDDADLRESLGSIFEDRGFRTVLARDGREAVDVVCDKPIHVVLIDFHMPRMTGLEALRAIRKTKASLPVILMSAELDEALSREVLGADAFSVHRKPVDLRLIESDVFRALSSVYNWQGLRDE